MSSSKFTNECQSRVAHRSTAASDEMLQSLQHKRLALAKIAATLSSKRGSVKSASLSGKHYGRAGLKGVEAKKRNYDEEGDSFVSDDGLNDCDDGDSMNDEGRPRKKNRNVFKVSSTFPPKNTQDFDTPLKQKTRTLSDSSEEEWLCKPRLNPEVMRSCSSAFPVMKREREKKISTNDSDDDSTDQLKETAKHGRKRKIFSDSECLDDCSEEGTELDSHSARSDDSEDVDVRYSRNKRLDGVMRACLLFFNTATLQQLLSTPRVTEKIANEVIKERPFETFDALESAVSVVPRGIGAVKSYIEFLENRDILERILDDCKDHAMAVANDFEQCIHRRLHLKLLDSRCQLHEYQSVGLNWLVMMHGKGFNCILGDEMGLGKTIQVIAFIAYLKEMNVRGPHLVIVPSSTIENWITEFIKWCPKIGLLTYYGSQEGRRQLRHTAKKKKDNIDVILTTYNMITSKHDDRKFFKNFSLNYVIYDEGHMLKNCGTERYRNLMKVKGKRKILMTGTPLQNNLIELISLMYFVMTDIFTKYCEDIAQLLQHFKQQGPALESDSCSMYQKDRIEQAKQILQPYMLRRLKVQVLSHLPEKHEDVIEVEMLEAQKELYENVLESARGLDGDTNNAYGALMRLRQAANHPLLRRVQYTESVVDEIAKTLCAKEKPYVKKRWEDVADELCFQSDFQLHTLCGKFRSTQKFMLNEDLVLDSGKCHLLDQLLPTIKEKGDKVLIFSQFTSMLDILEVYLRIRNYSFKRLDGSTPVMERQEMINEFNSEPEVFAFLLSTRAGGLGINLTSANHIILHDIDFNPYNDKQAEDRCHRMGQEKNVFVTRLVSKDTVEVDIHRLALKKLQLEKAITVGVKGQLEDESLGNSCTLAEPKSEELDTDTLNILLSSAIKRKSIGEST